MSHPQIFVAAILGGIFLSAQPIPDQQHKIIDGFTWRYSQKLKVNILVPVGWSFLDLSNDPEPKMEIYISPLGVSSTSPEYRYSLFGGLHLKQMAIPTRFRGAITLQGFLAARRKSLEQNMLGSNSSHPKNSHYLVGAYEYFERYEYSGYFKTMKYIINDEVPCGYEVEIWIPGEDLDGYFEKMEKAFHLMQISRAN